MPCETDSKRIVAITGAGGIGKEAARRFLESGDDVILLEHPAKIEEALQTAESLRGETGNSCIAYPCDISDRKAVKQAFEAHEREFSAIHVLVNTAGIMPDAKPLIKMDWDEMETWYDKILSVNLKGTIYTMRAVLPIMRKQNYGRIVNCASIAAFGGDAGNFYSVSKAAVARLTARVAIEAVGGKNGATYNIRINAVAPGIIQTPMTDDVPEKFMEPYLNRTPIHRKGTAQEVAYWIHFLASDENTLCLGQTITLDGGWSIA